MRAAFAKGLSKPQIRGLFQHQSAVQTHGGVVKFLAGYRGKCKGDITASFHLPTDVIPDPSALSPKRKNLILFDDIMTGPQSVAEDYYTRGRHSNTSCIYISQNYFKLPRQTIRENSNLLVLFKQDDKNLQHIYQDRCSEDSTFLDFALFKSLCHKIWSAAPYNFVVIDSTRLPQRGKYRQNLNAWCTLYMKGIQDAESHGSQERRSMDVSSLFPSTYPSTMRVETPQDEIAMLQEVTRVNALLKKKYNASFLQKSAVQKKANESLRPVTSRLDILSRKVPARPPARSPAVHTPKEESAEASGDDVARMLLAAKKVKNYDADAGLVRAKDGRFSFLGQDLFAVTPSYIQVSSNPSTRLAMTSGLWELLIAKDPSTDMLQKSDILTYQTLLHLCDFADWYRNVHPRNRIRKTNKWINVLTPLYDTYFAQAGPSAGQGVALYTHRSPVAYAARGLGHPRRRTRASHRAVPVEFLPSNITALKKKLVYLLGEYQAGNTLSTFNEIGAILRYLKSRGKLPARYNSLPSAFFTTVYD